MSEERSQTPHTPSLALRGRQPELNDEIKSDNGLKVQGRSQDLKGGASVRDSCVNYICFLRQLETPPGYVPELCPPPPHKCLG